MRVSADIRTRELFAGPEVTLDRIYDQIALRFPEIPRSTIDTLRQLELETEEALVLGVPATLAYIRRLLAAGERVVLLADTPLPEATVRRLLGKAEARLAECPLFISASTAKAWCWTGLFRRLLREEGIPPGRLVHHTFSRRAEVEVPSSLRIGWSHCTGAQLTELEFCSLEEHSLFSQLLCGASKTFRVLHPDASPQAVIGACLAGPMFYGFVLDVLRQAEERGIPKLYFIARDGMIFLRIAEAIAREHGIAVELRYLYGSRRAFRLPSVFDLSPREHRWLGERIPALSLAMLAERVDMRGEDVHRLLPAGLRQRIPDLETSLPPALVNDILRAFDLPEIRGRILDNARRARDQVIAYLDQEGFFAGERVGTVDIGWMGGTQDSLYKVAASHRRDIELHGFYFGLFHYSSYTTERNRKTPFAIRPNHTEDNIIALHTELLAQADHGQTVGFRRAEDGRMVPVLGGNGGHLRDWGVADFHAGVTWFATEYAQRAKAYPLMTETFLSVIPRLFHLMKKPTSLIAETLGSVPYSGDHCDLRLRESAPSFSLGQALAYSFREPYERRRLMTEWYEASLVRSPLPVALILRLQPVLQGLKYDLKHKHSIRFVLRKGLAAARRAAGVARRVCAEGAVRRTRRDLPGALSTGAPVRAEANPPEAAPGV